MLGKLDAPLFRNTFPMWGAVDALYIMPYPIRTSLVSSHASRFGRVLGAGCLGMTLRMGNYHRNWNSSEVRADSFFSVVRSTVSFATRIRAASSAQSGVRKAQACCVLELVRACFFVSSTFSPNFPFISSFHHPCLREQKPEGFEIATDTSETPSAQPSIARERACLCV